MWPPSVMSVRLSSTPDSPVTNRVKSFVFIMHYSCSLLAVDGARLWSFINLAGRGQLRHVACLMPRRFFFFPQIFHFSPNNWFTLLEIYTSNVFRSFGFKVAMMVCVWSFTGGQAGCWPVWPVLWVQYMVYFPDEREGHTVCITCIHSHLRRCIRWVLRVGMNSWKGNVFIVKFSPVGNVYLVANVQLQSAVIAYTCGSGSIEQ